MCSYMIKLGLQAKSTQDRAALVEKAKVKAKQLFTPTHNDSDSPDEELPQPRSKKTKDELIAEQGAIIRKLQEQLSNSE